MEGLLSVTRGAAIASLMAVRVIFASQAAAATIQLESAAMGPTGIGGGQSISATQFVGWRFEIDFSMVVTEIGGHLLGTEQGANHDIFAVIVALDSVNDFPRGEPFSTDVTLGTSTFMPPLSSNEILVPFQATLTEGSYALIFGSGDFGALGKGAIPNSINPDVQTDIDPTTITSYIFWSQPQPPGPYIWREGLASQMRFVVQGAELAGTADFQLDGDIDGDDLAIWQANFGTTDDATIATGSADNDGDSDGADFLAWQRQFGSGVPSLASSQAVPEPTSVFLLLFACFFGFPNWRLARR